MVTKATSIPSHEQPLLDADYADGLIHAGVAGVARRGHRARLQDLAEGKTSAWIARRQGT